MEDMTEKLQQILHGTEFCGICLNTDEDMNTVYDEFEIIMGEQTQSKTLREIIEIVFNYDEDFPFNIFICHICTENAMQSYIFTQNAIYSKKLFNYYINDLYNKSCFIRNNVMNSPEVVSKMYIALDPPNKCIDKVEENRKEEKQRNRRKQILPTDKNKFECSICKIILPSYKEWKAHEAKTHKTILKCNICQLSFTSLELLMEHYKLHSKARCKICLVIVQGDTMMEHMKKYHKSIHMCSFCDEVFYSARMLLGHQKKCHKNALEGDPNDELDKCICCEDLPCIHYSYLMSYREQALNGSNAVKCLDCDTICDSKDHLIAHANENHLNIPHYICDCCRQKFGLSIGLKNQIDDSTPIYKCQYCDNEFENPSFISESMYPCSFCTVTYNCLNDKRDHERFVHGLDVDTNELFDGLLLDDFEMEEHVVQTDTQSDSQPHSQPRKQKQKPLSLDCVLCQEHFDSEQDLQQHLTSHSPSSKYSCKICDTKYKTLQQLRLHDRIHSSAIVICEHCGKKIRRVVLDKHMAIHSNPTPTCETCGKTFENFTLLKFHQRTHMARKSCPKCKKLISSGNMAKHMRIHEMKENPNIKPPQIGKAYKKCQVCDYITWNKILLDCHMNRYHLQITPYMCDICGKSFIGKHLLKNHLKKHSTGQMYKCNICKKKLADGAGLKIHLRVHTGEKPFTCEVCGRAFRQLGTLNVHQLKKHSENSIKCPMCEHTSYSIKDLRKHVVRTHWKNKHKKFNYRELKGLSEEYYYLFEDIVITLPE